ncbi:CocE/NonD family hydrolase [Roseomonas xinghualingensis]|uniref:CocE/NonD family hydrolase n=1 Tax=Roseomonas xinghualingensis TaxID=2986475 RepID=UPI0021F22757|nr:CocE/NonD family hydrolase [Roseomonas sp. SXEYE001]MCV4209965.1 CocE/NonD family hydrolase [Roseomonas sp. SXEYE001]
MSDTDHQSTAWRVTPGTYLAGRAAEHAMPASPISRYVTMRDGCRIALDAWVPEGAAGPVPTVLILTPYYRRFAVTPGSDIDAIPNASKFVRFLVPRGYAVVVVDVRGTGASFGTRDSFRSPREREDSREIADWVTAQPWCDGRLGATGISYPGAQSDFLASTGHPAVKAIAPLFAMWDTWHDHYYPGGVFLNRLSRSYDELMIAMDHDRRDLLKSFAYYSHPDYQGPAPVDEDTDGTLLVEAIREHLGNFHMPDFITEFRFREEPLPYDASFSSASFSPYTYSDQIRPDVAVMATSGWMDGTGFSNAAIIRFLTLKENPVHLLLGPWDHGARSNVSPWRGEGSASQFPLLAQLLRFFDHYLLGRDTGLQEEARIHYFSIHAERWQAAQSWPPVAETRRLHLAAGALTQDPPTPSGATTLRVDFTFGTGGNTRYERLAAVDTTDYYPDWATRSDSLAGWTSLPLDADTEITGHAVADLWIKSSEPDASIFVYLSEVEANGTVRYVTEGLLRALHRKESPAPLRYQTSWPFRSYHRKDASPLVPGRAERLRIPLLPTSWVFKAGSRIRLSIAGTDMDHCAQVPHGRPPILSILHGGEHASVLDLPMRSYKD